MPLTRDHMFWSKLGVTIAVLGAYCLGTNVPVPGLDPEKLAVFLHSTPLGGGALDRVSIFSLGIMPLLNACLLLEALKLLAPSVRTWELKWHNRSRMSLAVVILALVMAVIQAAGVAHALAEVTGLVIEPEGAFHITCMATLVAGSAIAIAFANVIDRLGLGSGMWLLFLAPALTALPRMLAGLAILTENGEYSSNSLAMSAAFTLVAVAAIVCIVRGARAAAPTVATCVWTPFIANIVVGLALFAVGWVFTFSISAAVAIATPGTTQWCVALALAVGLCAWLYARSYRRAGAVSPVPTATVAATLAAILLAGTLLEQQLGILLPLGSVQLIIAATVVTSMIVDWGVSDPTPQAKAGDPAQSSV
jgi:preprotein translocase subunit SecY